MPKERDFYCCDNGCKLYPDCFNCPFPECRIDTNVAVSGDNSNQKRYRENHRKELNEKARVYMKEYKARKRAETQNGSVENG